MALAVDYLHVYTQQQDTLGSRHDPQVHRGESRIVSGVQDIPVIRQPTDQLSVDSLRAFNDIDTMAMRHPGPVWTPYSLGPAVAFEFAHIVVHIPPLAIRCIQNISPWTQDIAVVDGYDLALALQLIDVFLA